MIARIVAARACAKRGAWYGSEERTLPEAGDLHLRELQKWLGSLDLSRTRPLFAATVLREIEGPRRVADWNRAGLSQPEPFAPAHCRAGENPSASVSRPKSVRD